MSESEKPDSSSSKAPKQLSLLAGSSVNAGFPSPANDYLEGELDLNQFLIQQPTATFFVRVEGESMIDAGIFSGDILVVDRSKRPVSGQIVVAVVDNEFTVKRLKMANGKIVLVAENPAYPDITLQGSDELTVWGVVSAVVRKML